MLNGSDGFHRWLYSKTFSFYPLGSDTLILLISECWSLKIEKYMNYKRVEQTERMMITLTHLYQFE